MNSGRRHTDNIVRGNYHEKEGENMRLDHKTINGNLVELFQDERDEYSCSVYLNKVAVSAGLKAYCELSFENLSKGLESVNNQMKTEVIG